MVDAAPLILLCHPRQLPHILELQSIIACTQVHVHTLFYLHARLQDRANKPTLQHTKIVALECTRQQSDKTHAHEHTPMTAVLAILQTPAQNRLTALLCGSAPPEEMHPLHTN